MNEDLKVFDLLFILGWEIDFSTKLKCFFIFLATANSVTIVFFLMIYLFRPDLGIFHQSLSLWLELSDVAVGGLNSWPANHFDHVTFILNKPFTVCMKAHESVTKVKSYRSWRAGCWGNSPDRGSSAAVVWIVRWRLALAQSAWPLTSLEAKPLLCVLFKKIRKIIDRTINWR